MKKKVVLFGASVGGENYIQNQKDYTILAIMDNDSKKIGTFLKGIKIISPNDLMKYDYELIIITSTYYNPIRKQLIENLGVEEKHIMAASKSLLKGDIYPFEDDSTRQFATDTLVNLCTFLENKKITYFLDYGTLLGVVRDQNIITWDDDMDITCYLSDYEILTNSLEEFIEKYSSKNIEWKYAISKHPQGHFSSVVLTFNDKNKQLKDFHVDIWLLYFENNLAVQSMNKCNKIHFEKTDKILYENVYLNVPFEHEKYLQHTYGDWQTPKKDTTFADYPFAFEN